MSPTPSLSEIREDVRRALHEDIGHRDLSAAAVPDGVQAEAELIVRGETVLCGRDWFEQSFLLMDERFRFDWQVAEGQRSPRNQVVCVLDGPARPLLTAERTALNFLQLLSGVATRTREYVEAVAGTGVEILDTRKTLPGLRRAEKYAVACGGGTNHRMGLYDGILLKENHILACGNIIDAVEEARTQGSEEVEIEVEVEDDHQLREALAAGVDAVLLDNMSVAELEEAVRIANGQARLEASGGITLKNVRAVAESGVDCISIGELTKDIRAVDLSLRMTAVTA